MSALIRVSAGAIAIGLYCMPLGAAVAQNTTDRAPSNLKPAQSQNDAADPIGQRADPTQPGQPLPGRPLQGRQPYTANFRGTQPTAAGQTQEVDQFFAACFLAHNKAEVELGQLAQQQSQNPEVKQFAEQMITDHTKMIQQLQQIAGAQSDRAGSLKSNQRNTSDPAAPTNSLGTSSTDAAERAGTPGLPGESSSTPRTDATTLGATGRPAGNAAVQQIASINRQITERCLQAAKEELQKKSGAEFDKCYIGNAIGGHMHALAALEVLGQQSQGQLAQVAQQAQPTVQKHLDHAKQLMAQLEGQAGSDDSRAAERPTSRSSR